MVAAAKVRLGSKSWSSEPWPPSMRLVVQKSSQLGGCHVSGNLGHTRLSAPSRHTSQAPFFRSVFWERTVFCVLERVERLPPTVQSEIATRVGKYIHFAQAATDDATMTRFIEAAAGERAKVDQKSTGDPLWSAPALAEAWCVSRLGLTNGNMNRLSAMSVITAV